MANRAASAGPIGMRGGNSARLRRPSARDADARSYAKPGADRRAAYGDASPANGYVHRDTHANSHSADRRSANGYAYANPANRYAYRDSYADAGAERLHGRGVRSAPNADARLQSPRERDGRGVDGGAASPNAA